MTRTRSILAAVAALLTAGCANLGGLAGSLGDAIARQPDPEIVRDGAPAYLIMADTFAERAPGDAEAQLAAARLYGAYAGAFIDDEPLRLTQRAWDYARAGLCLRLERVCDTLDARFPAFRVALATEVEDAGDARTLYRAASAWAGWVRARASDYAALADLPKIEAAFARVLAIEPTIDHGNAHAYLGVLLAQRPQALGGQPADARQHFERAIEISGRNLMAKVLYAEHYARLVFDRGLHERLLDEVLAATPRPAT
ncbi:MAG: TRAP transporter TatT component family protein [Halofilum sp. (in: g-proteobacteria)]|nr:TRAP transporter TatT component family protein [Halofilum sp. (in: g-proteobacteria)]